MTLKTIEKTLCKYSSFAVLSANSDTDIEAITLVTPETSYDNDRCLYITSVHSAQNILCNRSTPVNTVFLDESDQVLAYTELLKLLDEEKSHEIAFGQILYLLVQHKSLHEAVNHAADFLGRSLVITDLSFKVIDYSTDTPVTDPLWNRNITRGYCTGGFIETINKLIPNDSMPSDSTPFRVNCDASTENKICSKLIYEGHHIGYLILLDNEKGLLDFHFAYLSKIASVLVEFLRLQPDFDSYLVGVTAGILMNMLEGEDVQISSQRLRASGVILPKWMRCVIFVPDNTSKHTQAFLEKRIKSTFPMAHIFSYEIFVLALINADRLSLLQSLPPEDDIIAYTSEIGVSASFSDIELFPAHFRQAARSCHLSHRIPSNGKLKMYEDFRFYDLLNSCSDKNLLEENIHDAFGILYSYDIKKEASLLNTLKSYIANDMNAKKTADELFLHRNTLKYRLDKIQGLTGIDFENVETKFQLALSTRINLLINKY